MIPNEDINQIRDKANIVDVISSYINLEPKGKNFFGLCPFHDDHDPSMSISQTKQVYICFSGETLIDGLWSSWKGQIPKKFFPFGSKLIYDETISTILALFLIKLISSLGIIEFFPSDYYILPTLYRFPLFFSVFWQKELI